METVSRTKMFVLSYAMKPKTYCSLFLELFYYIVEIEKELNKCQINSILR